MNLKQLLQAYIDHRLDVITRRTRFELQKAEARAHILEGLLIAVQNIDEVVQIIRASRTKEEAAQSLIARFKLTRKQVNAILEMRLHQLTGLAMEVLQQEYDELMKRIEYLRNLLASRELLLGVVKDELIEVRDKYSDPRRTELTTHESDIDIADLIPRHSCVITVSGTGYIKRVSADTYKTQHKGGKGVIGMGTKDEDHLEHLFFANSHDLIFFITDKGVMHWLNVYEIAEGSRTGRGKAIINMIKVEPGETIKAMITTQRENIERDDLYLVMSSKSGYIKKTPLSAFKNLRRGGIRALTIGEDDDLVGADISDGSNEIILATKKGMACRFSETQLRPMGRTARGVTGMRFKLPDDEIVSMAIVPTMQELESEEDAANVGGPEMIVVTDGGMGKRSFVSTYRKTNRGAKGVVNIRLKENESVVSALIIDDSYEILITTLKGLIVRIPAKEIRTIGRASKGVKVMRLKEGDLITGVAKILQIETETSEAEGESVSDANTESSEGANVKENSESNLTVVEDNAVENNNSVSEDKE